MTPKTNTDYFLHITDWSVIIMDRHCVLCEVQTEFYIQFRSTSFLKWLEPSYCSCIAQRRYRRQEHYCNVRCVVVRVGKVWYNMWSLLTRGHKTAFIFHFTPLVTFYQAGLNRYQTINSHWITLQTAVHKFSIYEISQNSRRQKTDLRPPEEQSCAA